MARLRLSASGDASDTDTIYRETSVIPRPASVVSESSRVSTLEHTTLSTSPAASSDKENQVQIDSSDHLKRLPPGKASHPSITKSAAKRKRVSECDSLQPRLRLNNQPDPGYYDPNQDIDERRETRKGLRKIYKDVCDNKNEYLQPHSNGLRQALHRLEGFQSTVKQTSDATIDSRTLVDVGDLTYKKTQRLIFGEAAQGIDVDEFVSKCVTFMRSGGDLNDHQHANARVQRQMLHDGYDSEEVAGDQGDALDWAWLGSQACAPSNLRPGVSPFLLGPLSAPKRARVLRLRRERLQARAVVPTTQPKELKETDLERSENSNLVGMCRGVLSRLALVTSEGRAAAAEEYSENMSSEQEAELLRRHHMCKNEGVSLVDFAINPYSFGQTVENLFYISFLIKDGHVGVSNDEEGEPSLHITAHEEDNHTTYERKQSRRHHGVLSIDLAMWRELVEVYEIRHCLIPHRADNEVQAVLTNRNGWY